MNRFRFAKLLRQGKVLRVEILHVTWISYIIRVKYNLEDGSNKHTLLESFFGNILSFVSIVDAKRYLSQYSDLKPFQDPVERLDSW